MAATRSGWFLAVMPLLFFTQITAMGVINLFYLPGGMGFWGSIADLFVITVLLLNCLRGESRLNLPLSRVLLLLAVPLSGTPSFWGDNMSDLRSVLIFVSMLFSVGLFVCFFVQFKRGEISEGVINAAFFGLILLTWFSKYTNMQTSGLDFVEERSGFWGENHIYPMVLILFSLLRGAFNGALFYLYSFLSISRGVYLSAAVFTLLWLLFGVFQRGGNGRSGGRAKKYFFSFIVLAAFVLAVYFSGLLSITASAFLGRFGLDIDTAGTGNDSLLFSSDALLLETVRTDARLTIFSAAIELVEKNGLFGLGLGSFAKAAATVGLPSFSNAHNLFLTALCEGGAVYLVTIVVFF
ncbi:MAG: O-antigen ligase family protein, partial [Negativicutes bacterium]|nr:O-antigen ligase family protein [Negativicutes bacterium]